MFDDCDDVTPSLVPHSTDATIDSIIICNLLTTPNFTFLARQVHGALSTQPRSRKWRLRIRLEQVCYQTEESSSVDIRGVASGCINV